jgi:hypothetical protein
LSQLFKEINFKRLDAVNFRLVSSSLAWGLISYGLLFNFYYRGSSIDFRYLVEFSAAINVIFIALIFLIFFYLNSYFKRKDILLLLFVFLGGLFFDSNQKFFEYNNRSFRGSFQNQITDKAGIERRIASFNRRILLMPYLPEVSYCGQSYSTAGLIFQYEGWNIHKDCLVSVVTSAILPSRKCVTLNYTIKNIQRMPKVQVKRDLIFFKLVSSQISSANTKNSHRVQITQLFCSDEPSIDKLARYSIGWVTYDQLNKVPSGVLPIKLNWFSIGKEHLINGEGSDKRNAQGRNV